MQLCLTRVLDLDGLLGLDDSESYNLQEEPLRVACFLYFYFALVCGLRGMWRSGVIWTLGLDYLAKSASGKGIEQWTAPPRV